MARPMTKCQNNNYKQVYNDNRNMATERSPAHNSSYKKLAVQCSADTFVVNQTLVLRINICGKNRQLLVAANR